MDLNKINFWKRLEMFVENVQVNDAMSEEEKEMIIRIAQSEQKLNIANVSGSLPLVSRDELISSLEDKRLCNMSNLPADIYYLSRKETADYLMDNYVITKRQ